MGLAKQLSLVFALLTLLPSVAVCQWRSVPGPTMIGHQSFNRSFSVGYNGKQAGLWSGPASEVPSFFARKDNLWQYVDWNYYRGDWKAAEKDIATGIVVDQSLAGLSYWVATQKGSDVKLSKATVQT